VTTITQPAVDGRRRLSRDRILDAALSHADAHGLDDLSMRKLGEVLGVAPMALYRHVANREDLVDGLIDVVFAEVELPATDGDWKTAMRRRAVSLHDVLARHRWAIGLMESRSHPGPASLRHHDSMIGSLRAGGFDMAGAAHAYSLIDAYVYGFALTKMNLPFAGGEEVAEVSRTMLEPFAPDAYPNLVAFITEHAMRPGYDFGEEFGYGLDLILDGLEAAPRAG
jgi:AcrR family transcriptional regulator